MSSQLAALLGEEKINMGMRAATGNGADGVCMCACVGVWVCGC